MSVPESPWEMISLDFVTGLPTSSGYDSILVILDYLAKMGHFIPTTCNSSAVQVAHLFIDNIFRLHGLSKSIASDRDPKFTSKSGPLCFDT